MRVTSNFKYDEKLKSLQKILLLSNLIFFLSGCSSIKTQDAEETYKYWSGNKPPKEIQLINGQYYQSPHFSLEYEMFLKFKSEPNWFQEFIKQNKLEIDTTKHDWTRWTKLPEWFKPDENYLIYAKDQNNEFDRSRYFTNPENGICYIYETVGM